jgi:hypothetical protein
VASSRQNEEDIKAMNFARTVIWRPGLLGRGDKARLVEKLAKYDPPRHVVGGRWLTNATHTHTPVLRYVMSEMPVERLGHAMRLQAEHDLENEEAGPKVDVLDNKGINAIAKE